MNIEQLDEKYAHVMDDFNSMPKPERIRVIRFNCYVEMRELIRAKQLVRDKGTNAISRRIKSIEKHLLEVERQHNSHNDE